MKDLDDLLGILTGGDDPAAELAVTAIADYGAAALPSLIQLAQDPDPDRRWWAVRALAALQPPDNLPALITALNDPEEDVRLCAALAIRENPTPDAVSPLVEMLADDDRLLARLAGDALVAIGKPATGALLEAVINAPQAARLEACRSLAAIGDLDSVTTLFKLLDDNSAMLEYWANEGLERMGIGMSFFRPG